VSPPRKPRDIGNGLVCASFGPAGEWLSLASVDPEAGFVELTGLPLFDPELRGDADAVLRYRSWMRREEHAFLRVEAGRATISTREEAPRGTRGVVQRLVIQASHRDRPAGIRVRINGRLARPTLAQISQVESPSVALAKSRFKVREGTLRVAGVGAPVIVQAWLRHGGPTPEGSAEGRADMRVPWRVLRRQMPTAVAWVDWPGDTDEAGSIRFDLGQLGPGGVRRREDRGRDAGRGAVGGEGRAGVSGRILDGLQHTPLAKPGDQNRTAAILERPARVERFKFAPHRHAVHRGGHKRRAPFSQP